MQNRFVVCGIAIVGALMFSGCAPEGTTPANPVTATDEAPPPPTPTENAPPATDDTTQGAHEGTVSNRSYPRIFDTSSRAIPR